MNTCLTAGAKSIASLLLLSTLFAGNAASRDEAHAPLLLVKQRPALTLDGARVALDAAVAKANALGTTGSIAIVDAGGLVLAFARIDGSFPGSSDVAIGKARTAALFEKPTSNFEDIIRGGRTPMLALDDFTPLKGGVPLRVSDHVVGAIGVSGAASADQDEELAAAGAAALTAATMGS